MFELLFGETEGKILWESFHIAPYGLVQRACRHPIQVCQVGIHHNLLPPDHMDQGFNRPWRNSLFAGIRFLCHTLLCSQSGHSRTLVTERIWLIFELPERFVVTQPVISPTLQAPMAKRAILPAL